MENLASHPYAKNQRANRALQRFSLLMLLCLSAFILQGCGKKGPLYLPEEAPEKTSSNTANTLTIKPAHRSMG